MTRLKVFDDLIYREGSAADEFILIVICFIELWFIILLL